MQYNMLVKKALMGNTDTMFKSAQAQDPSAKLRHFGLRATPQRLAIAEELFTGCVHTSAQELYAKLKGKFPSLSPNTVYLTLAQFEERGLLRRLHVDGNTVFDSNTKAHDHAYCRGCGRLADLPLLAQETPPERLAGWRVEGENRIWFGLCPACAST